MLRRLGIGLGILILVSLFFLLANTWSQNQMLQQELALQKQPAAQVNAATPQLIVDKPNNTIPAVTGSDHIDGNPNARVFLVEYSDLECPYCKRFHTTLTSIKQVYGGQLGHVFRHFPLPIHANAYMEAQIAECVAQVAGSGAYYTFIDTVFTQTTSTGTSFDQVGVTKVAKDLGYNDTAISACYQANQAKARVDTDMASASARDITATPSIFIVRTSDGATKLIVGAASAATFQQAIDALLATN
jgi:protein-disulfide isomerase